MEAINSKFVKLYLNIIHRKLSNRNNLRGINLVDVVSKVMFLVITSRSQHILKIEATPIQFGASPKTMCPEDLFSLKTLLQIRKEHNLSSWVVFSDLIKAFELIPHGLMFELFKNMEYLLVL